MSFFKSFDRDSQEQKYAALRTALFPDVLKNPTIPRRVRLTTINSTALKTYQDVWLINSERKVDWDWPSERDYFRKKCPPRLEMAVWHENHLCGLLIASTSSSKKTLYIEGIEGAPYKHPLKGLVIPICIAATEAYAAMLGATEIQVKEPDPVVMSAYTGLGYTIRPSNPFSRGKSHAYKALGGTS